MHEDAPPRFARWLIDALADVSAYGPSLIGDLDEGYRIRATTARSHARRWYRLQALAMLARYGPRRLLPHGLGGDAAYAWRGLRRGPVFAIIIALTLAAGIGANVAILSIVDAIYFRSLPVPHAEQLVSITSGDRRRPERASTAGSSVADFQFIRGALRGVEDVAAYAMADLDAGDSLASEPTRTALVSGNYFRVLGVTPQRGRFIQPDEEDASERHPVAVISDHAWRARYHADANITGRSLSIAGTTFTIVGVAPPHFTGLHPEGRTDLWIPYTMTDGLNAPAQQRSTAEPVLSVFARRRPEATLAEVQASADVTSGRLRTLRPASDSTLALQVRIRDRFADFGLNSGVMLLGVVWFVVALVHLALCMNVASLMLARMAGRRIEMGVRLCLGASRGRILRQGIIEAMLLAAPGVILGSAVGWALTRLITQMQFLSAAEFLFDWRAALLVTGVSVFTVLQFGLLPAIDASRSDPVAMLRGAAKGRRGAGERLEMVSVAQVAISIVLLANAAAFASLLRRQLTISAGYDVDHTLIIETVIAPHTSSVALRALTDEALRRVSALPGIVAVAPADGAPLRKAHWFGSLSIPGRPSPANEPGAATSLQAVGPGYFATLGVPIVRGREFTARDAANGTRRDDFDVAIVNERLARRLWPGGDPLGKTIQLRGSPPSAVIGVARDFHDVSTVDVVERAYFPLLESTNRGLDFVIRTPEPAAMAVPRIRLALRGYGPLERAPVQTLSGVREGLLDMSRTATGGLTMAAVIAVALSTVGLYGLVAVWLAQRRREIGIRLALGAQRVDVGRLLVGATTRIVATGGVLGLVMAVGLVQIERGWIGPMLSLSIGVVAVVIVATVLSTVLALAHPLWRASRDVPAIMLR